MLKKFKQDKQIVPFIKKNGVATEDLLKLKLKGGQMAVINTV